MLERDIFFWNFIATAISIAEIAANEEEISRFPWFVIQGRYGILTVLIKPIGWGLRDIL